MTVMTSYVLPASMNILRSLCRAVLCFVTQLCPVLCDPIDCSLPGSSVHKDSPGKNTGVGCHGDLLNPEIEPKSPALQVDSLPSEPAGKPKNTGVGSLSLLQGIFCARNWIRASCIVGGFYSQSNNQINSHSCQIKSLLSSKPQRQ